MLFCCAGPLRPCTIAVVPLGFIVDPNDGTSFCSDRTGVLLAHPEHRSFQFLFYAISNSFISLFRCLFSSRGAPHSTVVMGSRGLASASSRAAGPGVL